MCARVCVFQCAAHRWHFYFQNLCREFYFLLSSYMVDMDIDICPFRWNAFFPSWSNLNSIKSDYNIYHHSTLEEAQVVCAHKGKLFVSIGFGADVYLYKGAHANDIHLYRYKQDKHLYWSGKQKRSFKTIAHWIVTMCTTNCCFFCINYQVWLGCVETGRFNMAI